ncbi:hypothetical protein [Paratractidigestivibacter sp.]|uniref:hypothetical protein n=1 Tax=Paratractidigestivibacter sp. TaxID=2847316 RepID=UPI002ACB0C25|nr:hypothetical protein [Paratractidigestivibacter sp.]
MGYKMGADGLLDFSDCENDGEKLDQCWDYFVENLSNVEVVAFDDKLVRGFTEVSFEHIVSGSSNKFDAVLDHDIPFVECRAARLPLIAKVIKGELKSQVYRMSYRRGKKTTVRRVLTVIEIEHEYYVVVLDEAKDIYRIRTAFPASKGYYDRCIRGQGTNAGIWHKA